MEGAPEVKQHPQVREGGVWEVLTLEDNVLWFRDATVRTLLSAWGACRGDLLDIDGLEVRIAQIHPSYTAAEPEGVPGAGTGEEYFLYRPVRGVLSAGRDGWVCATTAGIAWIPQAVFCGISEATYDERADLFAVNAPLARFPESPITVSGLARGGDWFYASSPSGIYVARAAQLQDATGRVQGGLGYGLAGEEVSSAGPGGQWPILSWADVRDVQVDPDTGSLWGVLQNPGGDAWRVVEIDSTLHRIQQGIDLTDEPILAPATGPAGRTESR